MAVQNISYLYDVFDIFVFYHFRRSQKTHANLLFLSLITKNIINLINNIQLSFERKYFLLINYFLCSEARIFFNPFSLSWKYFIIYILIPNWMVRPSVILSVRYRNLFPVVQFQNQAHIWNPRGTGHIFKTIWGADGAPIFFSFFIAV